MRKLIAVLTFASLLGLLAAFAVPAAAQGGPCVPVPNGNGSATCTVHLHDTAFPDMHVAPDICPDGTVVPGGMLSIFVVNGVAHITINKAGDEWDTSTLEGTFTFIADGTGTLYSGHFTEWFGDSFNHKNQVNHATINFVGRSASGARISLHVEIHFSTDANGGMHAFVKTHC